MLGSPRRLDGNGATWEPCEPLMNIFREKVIASKNYVAGSFEDFPCFSYFLYNCFSQVDLTTEACKEQLWEKHGGEFGTGIP